MNVAASVLATRRPRFWIAFFLLAALGAVGVWRMFPAAFSLLTLDIRMDRPGAIRAARQLAAEHKWGPAQATREVASFGLDSEVQAFVELAGGGKPVFTALIREDLHSPYRWSVRLFREGETNQTTVRFKPDGRPDGFVETLRENAPGASLAMAVAREIAETGARGAPWRVALEKFTHVESSQVTRPGGRVDHTFVYERDYRPLAEGRLRLRLVVSGERLTELTHFIKVPEAFTRRYAEMRSVNNAIAGVASGAMGLLYLVGGCGVGLFVLLRQRAVLWRPALICAGLFALLQLLGGLNTWPLVWMGYDTALTASGFVAQRQVALLAEAIGMGVLFFLSFVAAESLTRMAFPRHPQFWRFWSAPVAAATPALGRTVGGYLAAPVKLFYVVAFYYAASSWLGWWTPTDTLVDPNSLAHVWPWFTPLARALQAGFWEEMLFRAIPLAGAAMIGERLGRRRSWIGSVLVIQAVVFAAAHANYPGQPAYSRVVELMLPSLVYGAIYLRWGLVPAIILHFTYDVVLMALPLFASSASGIWIDRGAVMFFSLLPVWVVLWRRWRSGAAAELPVGFLNRDWVAPAARESEPSHPPWRTAAAVLPPAVWRWSLVLAVAGAGLWIGSADFKRLGPPLTINRGDAERVARAALAERGVKLPPHAHALVSVTARPVLVDRFVWTKAGRETYESLLGTYVPVPRWLVRFVSFTGDVAERAEEWMCFVGGDGRMLRIRHQLPEGRAGASLTREEARARVHEVLRERFGFDPAGLKEVSAVTAKRPKRADWTFVFQNQAITTIAPAEARISVGLAGDEVVDAYRFTFVPEDWEREQRKLSSDFRIGEIIRNLLLGLSVLAGVGAAIVALSRGRLALRLALTIGVITFAAHVLATANRWPATLAGFSTTRNYDLQRATAAGTALVGGLLMAVGLALLTGLASRWLRSPLAGERRAAGWGGALGWTAAGAVVLAGLVRGRAWPPWPAFGGAETFVPWLSALPTAITGYAGLTALLLLIFGSLDRWSAGWSRRRPAIGLLGVLVGCVLALGSDAPGVATWLGAAALLSVVLMAGYVFALRRDLTVLPIASAVVSITGTLAAGFQRQHPAALPAGVLAAIAVGALAWWWFKALRKIAAPEAASV